MRYTWQITSQPRGGARFDVLLQDELNHPSLLRLNNKLRGRYPVISIVHHLRASEQRASWQNALYRVIEKSYLASVDGFVFNSRATRASVESLLVRARPHVVAFPAGDRFAPTVTEQMIIEKAHDAGSLRVLFVGNIIERKGLHSIIEAMAQGGAPWTLTIVGNEGADARYAAHIRWLAHQLNVALRIRWLGPVADGALADEFSQHHILAVPSSYEGFGIVYPEAMSFGLPALASSAGAAREIITSGVDGFLVAPGDASAIARHMLALDANRDQLAAMGCDALKRYKRHPTWSESMARVRAFLSDFRR